MKILVLKTNGFITECFYILNVLFLIFLLFTNVIKCNEYDHDGIDGEEDDYTPRFELNNEKRLINYLLGNYKVKYGRPVENRTENIVVKLEVFLIQIIDLDERNQVLISNVETQYEWKDNGLKWDKDKYGGIEDIRLPVNQIWTPDIVLYNYADTRLEEKREVLAVISSNGKVRWRPSMIYKSTCQINIQNFPYDHQNCRMKFGSWTYDGDSIDIQFLDKPEINRELFLASNEWDVLSGLGARHEKKYECCKEYFPDVTYQIKIKRKGGFYNYILVLPCILLSFLTMVLFWLPPESPAKMLLGMNIFTSFFVMLLLLSKNVPSATDKIPLIGAYYCLNMVMIATSTCACTVVVHIFFRGNGKVPYLLRKIFLEFFARVLCMIPPSTVTHTRRGSSKPIPTDPMDPNNKAELYNTLVTSSNMNKMQALNRSTMTLSTLHETVKQQKQQIYESRTSLNTENDRSNTLMKNQHENIILMENSILYNKNSSISRLAPYRHSTSNPMNAPQGFNVPESDFYRQSSMPNPNKRQKKKEQLSHFSRQGLSASNEHVLLHQRNDKLNQELNFSFSVIENDIKEIRDYLRHTRKKVELKDTSSKNTDEWKRLALILDRTLFYIYIIVIVISVTLMFPR